MSLDKNDIDTYLYQLTERVKRLEKCMVAEDKLDNSIIEQLEIIKDCLKKQRELNEIVSKNFTSIKEYIDLVTGGNEK